MSILFSPLQIRNIELKNRIVVSPMCQYSANNGFANDWHLVHLGSRAVGGAGLIIMEATAIQPEGRISPFDLGIWSDEHIEPLKRITTFLHQQNCVAGIQLAHAGRKASISEPWNGDEFLTMEHGGWKTVAPSALPFSQYSETPNALTAQEINDLIAAFRSAALRALQAGFKVIELHAAHGYLIHEFLSPLSNNRIDKYGGSWENRVQFLIEIIKAVREVWKEELPLFVRISATDWSEYGWQLEDSVKLAKHVKVLGVDLIDCSSGGIDPDIKIPAKPNYQVPFSEKIRKTGMLAGAVGIIVDAKQAETILEKGQADLIFMGREMLRNPYFPMTAALDLEDEISWPKQYERAKRKKASKS